MLVYYSSNRVLIHLSQGYVAFRQWIKDTSLHCLNPEPASSIILLAEMFMPYPVGKRVLSEMKTVDILSQGAFWSVNHQSSFKMVSYFLVGFVVNGVALHWGYFKLFLC